MGNRQADGTIAERLQRLGAPRVLVQMASNGQILELKCEMPTCYCDHPDGERHFDPWPNPRYARERKWAPNADHYPTLKMDGGKLKPWNIRLAHVFCNNMDFGWRKRIRTMLEKNPTMSFEQIADALNKKISVHVPPKAKPWTAELVREAYTS
jgi:hypothetical protein